MPKFSKRSLDRLATCDERLQRIFNAVIEKIDCAVICGHRGREEQEEAFRTGASRAHYGESKHNYLPSCAVDVTPWPVYWGNKKRFEELAEVVKATAKDMGIDIVWGGNFKGFFDGPHFELTDTSKSTLPT